MGSALEPRERSFFCQHACTYARQAFCYTARITPTGGPAISGGDVAHPEIEYLLSLLDEAYSRAAWHGPNLRGSIRGVAAREAAHSPRAGRHNIWEIVVHAAYWKYAVRRRLVGEKRGSFPLKGSNWFRRPIDRSEKAWRADVALLDTEHRRLREAVSAVQPEDLNRPARGSRTLVRRLIGGIAFHDVYHAGQIQLIKRLLKTGKRR
jgi:hypothetical protein